MVELNQDFIAIHEIFSEILENSRTTQTNDERLLEAQFISRLAFVSSDIKDLEFATHRQIVERGLLIGNSAAECIVNADNTLQELAEEIGGQIMELAGIARRDFMRIPEEFVHPVIVENERVTQGVLSEVMLKLSGSNPITNIDEIIGELEAQQELLRNRFELIPDEIQYEVNYMRRQMNYVKAQVFPILEYSLGYFKEGTERIIENLSNCN